MSETKVFLIFKGDQPYQGKYSDTSPYGECSLTKVSKKIGYFGAI